MVNVVDHLTSEVRQKCVYSFQILNDTGRIIEIGELFHQIVISQMPPWKAAFLAAVCHSHF